jgi:hypothetical protein
VKIPLAQNECFLFSQSGKNGKSIFKKGFFVSILEAKRKREKN